MPEFSLPPVQGRTLGLSSGDLRGEVSLVNVFASWCLACREEHPVFMQLAASGTVPLHGLDYKDRPDDAARWLDTMGDPYTRTGADMYGRVAIDWGVYGVPETFVVSADGRIAYKHIGAVSRRGAREDDPAAGRAAEGRSKGAAAMKTVALGTVCLPDNTAGRSRRQRILPADRRACNGRLHSQPDRYSTEKGKDMTTTELNPRAEY